MLLEWFPQLQSRLASHTEPDRSLKLQEASGWIADHFERIGKTAKTKEWRKIELQHRFIYELQLVVTRFNSDWLTESTKEHARLVLLDAELNFAQQHATDSKDLRSLTNAIHTIAFVLFCLLYTSPSPRDRTRSRMPSSA